MREDEARWDGNHPLRPVRAGAASFKRRTLRVPADRQRCKINFTASFPQSFIAL